MASFGGAGTISLSLCVGFAALHSPAGDDRVNRHLCGLSSMVPIGQPVRSLLLAEL